MREETTVVLTSDDVTQAVAEYLKKRGIDCSGGYADFRVKTRNGVTDFECKITGDMKKTCLTLIISSK